MEPQRDGYGLRQAVDDDGNGMVSMGTRMAGERKEAFPAASFLSVNGESVLQIISKTTTVTINQGQINDTYLNKVHVYKALTGTVVITGFPDSDGAAKSITIPAGFVGTYDFDGAVNTVGALTVTASNAADDDNVAVLWKDR